MGEGLKIVGYPSQGRASSYMGFFRLQKSTRKLMTFLIDFGSQYGSQIHQKIMKKTLSQLSRKYIRKK